MKNQSPNKRAFERTVDDVMRWCGYAAQCFVPLSVIIFSMILIGSSASHPRVIAKIAVSVLIATVGLFFVRRLQEERRGDQ